jgi:signal transduction histidine kinase
VQIHPVGGGRGPAELRRVTGWQRAGTAARFTAVLLAGGVIGAVAFGLLLAALFTLVFSPLAGLGLPFLAVMTWLVRPLARLERHRVRWVTGAPVAEAYRSLRGSLLARVRILLTDTGTWRDLTWLAAQAVAGTLGLMVLLALAVGLIAMAAPLIWAVEPPGVVWDFLYPITNMARAVAMVPLGAGLVVVGWWACRRMAVGSARLSGWLLAPGEGARLRAQMEHLAETRAETVDARATELRRIERDLHDGAQARLVSLAMSLGMAEEEIDRDPDAARQLVAEARASASMALNELRDLVRGIHPPVLTERGIGAAIEALALASAVPVEADVQLDKRLPAPLESALYFVIAEALANVARHSDASWAFVRLWSDDGRLRLMVRDDGCGGADPARGSGLRGIQRRLAAFDGKLTLASPSGGPTELFAELACRQ